MLPVPPNGYLPEAQAEKDLQVFVHGGKYDPVRLPKRAEPDVVDRFVRKALDDKDLKVKPLLRCGELMRFFDLRERAGQLEKWLDRRQADDGQFPRLMIALNLAGDFGADPLREQAAKVYQAVLAHKSAGDHFPGLIDSLFHLAPLADPKWVSDALDQRLKALEARAAVDEDAAVAANDVKDWKADRLPSVLEARKKRLDLLKLTDPDRQRIELGRCYLQLERASYVDLAAWAVMMLQHECNETDPAVPARAFSHGMDLIVSRGSARAGIPEEEKKDLAIYVTRCKRAIEFYGGKLTEKQAEFAKQHDNPDQPDVLYWEPK
ncbi:MAG: hypothetical protein HRF43_01150 [Phycisphaerae bacterium]|jgi:hypothetical protein